MIASSFVRRGYHQLLSGKKKARKNLRKLSAHRPRVPGTQPDYRPVSQGLPVVYDRKTDRNGIFAGTSVGCPRDSQPSRRFSEILCDVSCVPFLPPILAQPDFVWEGSPHEISVFCPVPNKG